MQTDKAGVYLGISAQPKDGECIQCCVQVSEQSDNTIPCTPDGGLQTGSWSGRGRTDSRDQCVLASARTARLHLWGVLTRSMSMERVRRRRVAGKEGVSTSMHSLHGRSTDT